MNIMLALCLLLLQQVAVATSTVPTLSSLTLKHLKYPSYLQSLLAKDVFIHSEFAENSEAIVEARELIADYHGRKKLEEFNELLASYDRGHSEAFEKLRKKTSSLMNVDNAKGLLEGEYTTYEKKYVQHDAIVLLLDDGEIDYQTLVEQPKLLQVFGDMIMNVHEMLLPNKEADTTIQLLKEGVIDDHVAKRIRKSIDAFKNQHERRLLRQQRWLETGVNL